MDHNFKSQSVFDIHTHHYINNPGVVISCSPATFQGLKVKYPDSLFSVGVHPWNTSKPDSPEAIKRELELLESIAGDKSVVAIGETGLDSLRGASLASQEAIFRRHIELSEQLSKPLVIHCVKAWDKLLSLHKEYSPRQNWAIHGFRGKPQLARQLASRGIYLSLGKNYNPEVLNAVPQDLILSETDEAESLPSLPFDTVPAIARFLNLSE